jgi:hypothetical protein
VGRQQGKAAQKRKGDEVCDFEPALCPQASESNWANRDACGALKAAGGDSLRLLDPAVLVALQAFDALCCVIYQARKDDSASAWRFYSVMQDAELITYTKLPILSSIRRFALSDNVLIYSRMQQALVPGSSRQFCTKSSAKKCDLPPFLPP